MYEVSFRHIYNVLTKILFAMATNNPTGDGHRNGAVRGRSQTFNPKTELWVKRDTSNGQFIGVKTSSSTPFKGIRKEK